MMTKTAADFMFEEAFNALKTQLTNVWAKHLVDVYTGKTPLEEGEIIDYEFNISDKTIKQMVIMDLFNRDFAEPLFYVSENDILEEDFEYIGF
jgi:hypothetical protein